MSLSRNWNTPQWQSSHRRWKWRKRAEARRRGYGRIDARRRYVQQAAAACLGLLTALAIVVAWSASR